MVQQRAQRAGPPWRREPNAPPHKRRRTRDHGSAACFGRGLREVTRRLGDVEAAVVQTAAAQDWRRNVGPHKVRVLEIGAGWGRAITQLARRVGSDITSTTVEAFGMNKRILAGESGAIQWLHGDAAVAIPLPRCSIDFAYSITTMKFIDDKAKMIENVFATLSVNGAFRFRLLKSDKKHCTTITITSSDAMNGGGASSSMTTTLCLRKYLFNLALAPQSGVRIKRLRGKDLRCIEITKLRRDATLDLSLELELEKCYRHGSHQLFIRSAYTTRRSAGAGAGAEAAGEAGAGAGVGGVVP